MALAVNNRGVDIYQLYGLGMFNDNTLAQYLTNNMNYSHNDANDIIKIAKKKGFSSFKNSNTKQEVKIMKLK